MEPEMGHIEVFRLQLSDFHGALTLVCSRDFAGWYLLESPGVFKVQLMNPDRLAEAGRRLQNAAALALALKEPMQTGAVWRYEGVIEIGINDAGDAVYVQAAGLRIEPSIEQCGDLQFDLGRLHRDIDDVLRASTLRTIQTSIIEHMRDPELQTPDWARDELWDPVTGRRK
jgi:hypothetical protein